MFLSCRWPKQDLSFGLPVAIRLVHNGVRFGAAQVRRIRVVALATLG
jgi:hypothetical protein